MVIDLKTKSPVPTDTYDGHFGRVDGRRHAGRDLLVPLSCAEGDVNKERKRGGFPFFDPADCLHLLHPGATHMLDLTLRPVSPCLYPSRMYTFREIAVDIWSVMGIR